jgi:molybdenum cofactor cytidylyltransferase
MSIAIVILAAGSSSRMGQSKQLMHVGDESMLRNTIKVAQSSSADSCVVVLGSNEDAHLDAIIDLNVQIVVNPHWERGMGSSLKAGLKFLITTEKPKAILIMLSDQPAITLKHVDKIINAYRNAPALIIAAEYGGGPGVPALIDRMLFDELMAIDDASGAKPVLIRNKHNAHLIPIPEASIDLDTPEDFEQYKSTLH